MAGLKFNYTYGMLICVVHPKASQLLWGWFSVAWKEEGTERVVMKGRGEGDTTVLVILIMKFKAKKKEEKKTFTICIFPLLFHHILFSQNTFAARSVQWVGKKKKKIIVWKLGTALNSNSYFPVTHWMYLQKLFASLCQIPDQLNMAQSI